MATIEVPDRDQDAMRQLLRLSPDAVDAIKAGFAAAKGRYPRLVAALNGHVADPPAAFSALVNLGLTLREGELTSAELGEALLETFGESAGDYPAENIEALATFVDHPAIFQFVKALELRNAYEHILLDSRIITDVRPVFPDGSVERVEAAMINHTILIDYTSSQDAQSRRLYLAIDLHDLEALNRQIQRAIDKERATRAFIKAAKVMRLEPTEVPEIASEATADEGRIAPDAADGDETTIGG